jgi:hypothetical protein
MTATILIAPDARLGAPPLIDADAAGELLGVPASWLLAQARANAVPHVRLGRYVRFDADELEVWAQHHHHYGPRPEQQAA